MNHARIAYQALRYRVASVEGYATRIDLAQTAEIAVECGDPSVDTAIRHIGGAWIRAGLDPEAIVDDWPQAMSDAISADPTLLDAIDDIVRVAHRIQFSRRRGHAPDIRPNNRPYFTGRNAWARRMTTSW